MRRPFLRLLVPVVCVALALGARAAAAADAPPAAGHAERWEAADLPIPAKGATGDVAEWLKTFEPDSPGRFAYTVAPMTGDPDLRCYRVTYPSPMETPFPQNNTVPGELYLPAHPSSAKLPAAIVLDILDGTAIVPRVMARSLAHQGIAAFYFPMPYYNVRKPPGNAQLKMLDEDLSYVTAPLRQTVMDARRAKAILASRPDVDRDRIGITGVSLGGIMTSLVAGVDGNFYRVAPVIAGGDLATILFHARETRKTRELLLSKGVDHDRLEKLLAPVDPLTYASRVDPKTVLMINASRDEVIPRPTTDALWRAFGQPTILWMPTGHYTCFLYLPNTQQKVADFMLGREVKSLDFDRAPTATATQPAGK